MTTLGRLLTQPDLGEFGSWSIRTAEHPDVEMIALDPTGECDAIHGLVRRARFRRLGARFGEIARKFRFVASSGGAAPMESTWSLTRGSVSFVAA